MSAVVYTVVTAVVAAYIVLAVALYRREQRRPLERDRLIADARDRAGLPPAAPDNQPGTNHAWADECALIYSLPAYSAAREDLKKQIASDPYYADQFRRIADDRELAPDLADFADRLLKEIRDDQQKGEL